MGRIVQLQNKKTGENEYPRTYTKAIIDDQATPLDTLMQNQNDKIAELGSKMGFQLEEGYGYANNYNAVIPSKDVNASYNSAIIEPNPGDVISIKAVGGLDYRLWSTYNNKGVKVRISEARVNSLENEVLVTIEEGEHYLIINTLAEYANRTYVTMNNISDVIAQTQQDIAKVKSTSIWDCLIFKMIQNSCYRNTSFNIGSLMPSITQDVNYDTILLELNGNESVTIHGYGGSSSRLWSVYDENRRLTRISDESVYAIDNGVTITLTSTEKYLIVNSRVGYRDKTTVSLNNIPESVLANKGAIEKLNFDSSIGYGGFVDLSDSEEEIGKFLVYYNGVLSKVETSAPNSIRIVNVSNYDAVSFNSSISNGGNNYVATSKVCYAVTDGIGNVLLASSTFSYSGNKDVYINLPKGAVTLFVSCDTSLLTAINIKGYELNYGHRTMASEVLWSDNTEFLRYDNENCSIIRDDTSSPNKIGTINISNYTHLFFDASFIGGGSEAQPKLLYCFVDDRENVLATSVFYGNSGAKQKQISVDVPNDAVKLYISWDGSATRNIIGYYIKKEEGLDCRVSLESSNVSSYMKVQYNNNDYNYTKMQGYNIGYGSDYDKPNPVLIKTPALADNSDERTLIISDDVKYKNARKISLSRTDKECEVYNLICNKEYRYQVVTDNQVIYGGKFATLGNVRFLFVKANQNYTYDYIRNVRDLGGKKTSDGRMIRYGVISRGYELNHLENGDFVADIDEFGKKELISNGFNAELDLRTHTVQPKGELDYYINIPLQMFFFYLNIYNPIYSNMVAFSSAIKQILKWLKEGKGVYIHCQGGCDRTGALCFFLEGICGVTENEINKDYELSSRNRSREWFSMYDGANFDGDFRFAMEFIKGLKKYNDVVYTRCRSYKNSTIEIDNILYQRDGTTVNDGVKYCKWTNGETSYYTIDIYPTNGSIVYNDSFKESEETITEGNFDYYFNAGANVSSYEPVPITDNAVISALDNTPKPSLKEQFRMFFQIHPNGLTTSEMDELEDLLVC